LANDTSLQDPLLRDLENIARAHGLSMNRRESAVLEREVLRCLRSSERLEQLAGERVDTYPTRSPGAPPTPNENKFGAWAWKSSIREANDGPLNGKRIAIKDSICVRGLPMSIGTAMMADYVADEDATVVSRVLAAGAEIVGKAQCENLCLSGGSHTATAGPVRNPYNPSFSAGGSSSGNAVLVAVGDCELGIGGDAGGSIRMPAALSGVFGMKPTFGLVPCTGAFPIESSLDHLGPMAANTRDLATLLSVLAGPDRLDYRQRGLPTNIPKYEEALGEGVEGLRFGLLQEGFESLRESDGAEEQIRAAVHLLAEHGGVVEQISIPEHRHGIDIFGGIAVEGGYVQMIRDNGLDYGSIGHYPASLLTHFARARRDRPEHYSNLLKVRILAGALLSERYHGRFYALARRLSANLSAAYERAFASVDVLIMPTAAPSPVALRFGPATPDREFQLGDSHHWNTAPFNVTGHPAQNVPCGLSRSGLPVGLMLVGKHWDEPTLLRTSQIIEDGAWAGRYEPPVTSG
jgi:amidase